MRGVGHLNVGSKVGKVSLARTIVDEKGRIILPKRLRLGLGLTEGSQVSVQLQKERLIISKVVNPDDFIRDMEGFVKKDSPLPLLDPLSLKRIWERP
jgi:AbrB family looped-hinge helix DNA binding protein